MSIATQFPLFAWPSILWLMRCLSLGGSFMAAFGANPQEVEKFDPDMLGGSPAQLAGFLRHRGTNNGKRLKMVRSGGGYLPAPLAMALQEHFDRVLVSYGSTEAGVISQMDVGPDYKPGMIGIPYTRGEVAIVDKDGREVAAGEVGVIRLTTPQMCEGYLGLSAAHNAESFRDGGFYPGDMGRFHLDGMLEIIGRETDHLNIGGMKVNALVVDEILQNTPGVRDAACFLMPGNLGIGRLAAMAVLDSDMDMKTLVKNIRATFKTDQRTRKAMIPTQIFRAQTLPRNANGKIMRHVAAEQAQRIINRTGAR